MHDYTVNDDVANNPSPAMVCELKVWGKGCLDLDNASKEVEVWDWSLTSPVQGHQTPVLVRPSPLGL